MLQVPNIVVRCVFQLGTPLQPYAIVEDVATSRVSVVQITNEVFEFLVEAQIPLCEPVTVPPGSLEDQIIRCVFRIFIGAQEPVPFAVVEDEKNRQFGIVEITEPVFEFFRLVGVSSCSVIICANNNNK